MKIGSVWGFPSTILPSREPLSLSLQCPLPFISHHWLVSGQRRIRDGRSLECVFVCIQMVKCYQQKKDDCLWKLLNCFYLWTVARFSWRLMLQEGECFWEMCEDCFKVSYLKSCLCSIPPPSRFEYPIIVRFVSYTIFSFGFLMVKKMFLLMKKFPWRSQSAPLNL